MGWLANVWGFITRRQRVTAGDGLPTWIPRGESQLPLFHDGSQKPPEPTPSERFPKDPQDQSGWQK